MKLMIGIGIGYAIGHYFGPKINPYLTALYAWVKAKIGVKDED